MREYTKNACLLGLLIIIILVCNSITVTSNTPREILAIYEDGDERRTDTYVVLMQSGGVKRFFDIDSDGKINEIWQQNEYKKEGWEIVFPRQMDKEQAQDMFDNVLTLTIPSGHLPKEVRNKD